ncbi:hypothetical protein [Mesorhizobium sp. M0203]|uniref:hypothetical protein n=1 Tax=unclassified Mesorhizobium TaxID=325217 RepID=UPI00333A441D
MAAEQLFGDNETGRSDREQQDEREESFVERDRGDLLLKRALQQRQGGLCRRSAVDTVRQSVRSCFLALVYGWIAIDEVGRQYRPVVDILVINIRLQEGCGSDRPPACRS